MMAINARPKGKTRAQLKAARDRAWQKFDRSENEATRERSEGRCEISELYHEHEGNGTIAIRCMRSVTQVHHMLGKWRLRGRGQSALRDHKQATCDECHNDITGTIGGKKLRRIGGVTPHYTDVYERVR